MRAASGSCQMLNSARGRHIARRGIGAAHDDEPLDEARQLGLAHDRERDIGQRAGGDENETPGVGAGGCDDGFDRMLDVGRLLRLGQDGVPEAAPAVDIARVLHLDRDRSRRARPDGDVGAPGERENRPRVARRRGKGDVADDRGDAEDLRLRMGAGVEQRQRVVDSGVDVDDEGLGGFGHGRQFSTHLVRPV